jgi:hypothetical protein
VFSTACPKSIITRVSLEMLERFSLWKRAGGGSLMKEESKVAEAMLFLNEHCMEEKKHVET